MKCYSDHNEDIRTKGTCDYCNSSEQDTTKQRDFSDMKEEHTREEWETMIKAISSGEEIKISEYIYYYFLECLPPLYSKQSGFLLQEAQEHNEEGDAMRNWFYGTQNKGFFSQLVNEKHYLTKEQIVYG